jgi:UPF0755 protein
MKKAKSGRKGKKKQKRLTGKIIYAVIVILLAVTLTFAYIFYSIVLMPNTRVKGNDTAFLYIPTGSDFDDLKNLLYENDFVIRKSGFEWLAMKKNLPHHVYPGKYAIRNGMSNQELINFLRSGKQTPVNLVINNYRTREDFARFVQADIEPDSAEIMTLFNDSGYLDSFGFNRINILTMIIPNTYQVYWNITAKELFRRMNTEYKKFWNAGRLQKAEALGIDPVGVSILASIVEKETNKDDEKPDIAAVYLNRLNLGWKLQADPTLVYALGDFSINRVLNIHKSYDSPFNTYLYAGLPPGPICIPSIASIDAVLNRSSNKYLFFCARDDFSGYHVFATTNQQHSINAEKYRRALDLRNIKK